MYSNGECLILKGKPFKAVIDLYLVDDDELVIHSLKKYLRRLSYRVSVFQNAREALWSFIDLKKKPEILITDFVMQGMNGMELIQECRNIAPRLITILISGFNRLDIQDSYSEKPNHFIIKPFLPETLAHVIESELRKK